MIHINAVGGIAFNMLVSSTATSGPAVIRREFFDTGSLRTARIKTSSLGSRLLRGLFEGVARLSTVVPNKWSRSRRVLRAIRLRALAFDRRLFGGLVLRTKRDNAGISRHFPDSPGAFTRAASQARTVLRSLVLGDRAVAAGVQ